MPNLEPLLYEKSVPGREGVKLPALFAPESDPAARLAPGTRRSSPPALPSVSELDAVRHFTRLSQKNFAIDKMFYPLGSCTMKYNPKANDAMAALPGFAALHPMQSDADDLQGILHVYHEVARWLSEICGMDQFTLAPAAGANGEFAGMSVIAAYHRRHQTGRDTVIVPVAAHGTNPATAALCGFKVREVPEREDGCIDLAALRKAVDSKTAGLMLTNPNTLGVFERHIAEVADVIHEAGGLVYYDGANLNAIAGRSRPGDMGYDVVHVNLHKTFSTPHGGGGPGSGPVGVKKHLVEYLPVPRITKVAGSNGTAPRYELVEQAPHSIGRMMAFAGNTGIIVRAYNYMLLLGAEGIRRVATFAVLNANYVKKRLEARYEAFIPGLCKHEFVLTLARELKDHHVTAYNVAKRLLDKGFHAPTVYFPTTVRECLLIEPTETESLETLDRFIDAMMDIYDEIEREDPDLLHAPRTLEVGRLDDVKAAKELNVCCRMA